MLLHPKIVAQGVLFGVRYRIKKALRWKSKVRAPVLESGIDRAVERHSRICRTLLAFIPSGALIGKTVAEVGCGDCLAAADMMLSLGAKHVHLVEGFRIALTEKHRLALAPLVADPLLPNRGEILLAGNPPLLDPEKATFHHTLFEDRQLSTPVDFLYSFDVIEHVEDLRGFFKYCAATLNKGGFMVHKFDLSGHEFFEDPMPPLDFQTYPNWLYDLIFPRYRRACRWFLSDIVDAMVSAGFEKPEVEVLRAADEKYIQALRPSLRKEARDKSVEELAPLDIILRTRLPQ